MESLASVSRAISCGRSGAAGGKASWRSGADGEEKRALIRRSSDMPNAAGDSDGSINMQPASLGANAAAAGDSSPDPAAAAA